MFRKNAVSFITFCMLCLLLLSGCGASGASKTEPEPDPKVLTFTDMTVKTETRTGFFGGRYASFEVKGSITNKTDNPINEDNLPKVSWGGDNSGEADPEMSQDKLLTDENCSITWKEELTIDGSSIPEVSFKGSVEFTGLDDCQSELNEQLQAIASEYEAADTKKENERKAEEKKKADAAKKLEDDKKALSSCKGKSAQEALTVTEGTDYEPTFKDSYDVDVTSDVKKAKEDSDIANALVTDVKIADAGWFSSASVTFTLDYVEEAAKKEREEKAAKEKAEKEKAEKEKAAKEAEAAAKAKEQEEKDSKWIKGMPGRPVVDVLDEIKDRGLGYSLTIHPSGSDVTETLTRDDIANRGLVVMKANRVGYVSPYGGSKQKEGDIDITAVDPTYWENEKKLEETLPPYNAEKAVKDYAKSHGMKSVEPWYEEAWDASTWYIKGYAKYNGTRYTFEAKVTGTKATPLVVEFNYY